LEDIDDEQQYRNPGNASVAPKGDSKVEMEELQNLINEANNVADELKEMNDANL